MATAQQFLAACVSHLGYTELPKGSNCNKFSKALGRPCERWCADFLVAVADTVGLVLPSRSAATTTMLAGFRREGRAFSAPAVGDFAFWQFDSDPGPEHVSVVESFTATTVTTIDGNSSSSGSQSNGDAVVRRTRSRSAVIAYGRPGYEKPNPPKGSTVFNPPYRLPFPIASSAKDPVTGGSWLLLTDGSIQAFDGARYLGGCNEKAYFAGRTAKALAVGSAMTAEERAARPDGYVIVATSGERYGPGF